MAKQMSFGDLVPKQPAYFDVPDVECKTNAGKISGEFATNFNKTTANATKSIQTD